MCKIIFDLNEIKEFLDKFKEIIPEKIDYDIDDTGWIYSKRYLKDELNENRFEEFIQGHIRDKSKIEFNFNGMKEFLNKFEERISAIIAWGGTYNTEKIIYDLDDNGYIYSKRYINDELNENRFEEFIQGQIIEENKKIEYIALY